MHPALRTWHDELRETCVRLLAYVGGIGALAMIAAAVLQPAVHTTVEPAEKPTWRTLQRWYPSFSATLPDDPTNEPDYAVRRHIEGRGRQDVIWWGAIDGDAPYLSIEIYRPGSEITAFAAPEREISARIQAFAAEQGAEISGFNLVPPIGSKFGPMTAVEFTLRGDKAGRHCLGYARDFTAPLMQISGWRCMAEAEAIDRAYLACVLDRLTLLAAGSDPAIGELFAHADLRRNFCRQPPAPPLMVDLDRTDWIASRRPPDLRGLVAGR